MTRYERQRSGSLFQYAPLSCNVCGELFIANLLKEHRNAISCDLLHHTLAPPHVRYLVAQHKRALYGCACPNLDTLLGAALEIIVTLTTMLKFRFITKVG